jgi:hypothetical protein
MITRQRKTEETYDLRLSSRRPLPRRGVATFAAIALADATVAVHGQLLGLPPAYRQGRQGRLPGPGRLAFVQGDPKIVTTTVLNGRAGMPAFKDDLTDADLSAILTYVRASWGNKASAIKRPTSPPHGSAPRPAPRRAAYRPTS